MKKCGCRVTAALQEEISQAGRHSPTWRRQQKLAERQSWVTAWWCSFFPPIHQGKVSSGYPIHWVEWKYLMRKGWVNQMMKLMKIEPGRNLRRTSLLNRGDRGIRKDKTWRWEGMETGGRQSREGLRLQCGWPVQREVRLTSLETNKAEGEWRH